MNKWLRLALFSFISIIVLNMILSIFFGAGSYNGYQGNNASYGYGYYNNAPMHRGMMNGMFR